MKVDVLGESPTGESIEQFAFRNGDCEIVLIGYGASLRVLRTPDRHGDLGDVALGFATLAEYCGDQPHFGATVGRLANRIAHARFPLEGGEVRLTPNEGVHHLHGGPRGFSRRTWRGEPFEAGDARGVRFHRTSPDGEEGYPGRLELTSTYTLQRDGALVVEHTASTDRSTVVNLTHHGYFHLGDGGATPVLDHRVQVAADAVVEVDDAGIPTGRIQDVAGTPLDLREPTRLGDRVPALSSRGGFDHCYALRGERVAARVFDPESGRTLDVETTHPGLQLYTGNFLDGRLASPSGIAYGRWHAFCLEAQGFPDAPNHATFPSTQLEPGAEYAHTTVYRFGVEA